MHERAPPGRNRSSLPIRLPASCSPTFLVYSILTAFFLSNASTQPTSGGPPGSPQAPAPGLNLSPSLSFSNNQSNAEITGVFRIVGSQMVPFSDQGDEHPTRPLLQDFSKSLAAVYQLLPGCSERCVKTQLPICLVILSLLP